jgi:diaminohydroxyphosphoribosylaminopyrimidine deaminase/5-amino-6-(5-phosphoribosylamino)uracil reductase
VHNGRIIGEGYHQKYGEWHAEVNAINKVQDKSLLKDSTIYVNLEPCAHHGKTPPCASLIASHQIKRVVIGSVDPFALVAGKGIEILKNAGCEVTVGVLEDEAKELNRRFFTFHQLNIPFIILKWAETLDGYMDKLRTKDTPREPFWITNRLSRRLVHKWRTEESAILVGTNTALKDNPSLNVRNWEGQNPIRLVLDRTNRLPKDLALFDATIPTVIFSEAEVTNETNLKFVHVAAHENVLLKIMEYCHSNNIQSLIVEGGAMLLTSFLEADLWDEARIFVGNKLFGGGVSAPKMHTLPIADEWIGDSRLLFYRNKNSVSKL